MVFLAIRLLLSVVELKGFYEIEYGMIRNDFDV